MTPHRKFALILILMLTIGILPTTQTTHAQTRRGNTPRFEAADCPFNVTADMGQVDCGYLVVPENRGNPNNVREIELAVAIFRSTSPNPAPDPYLYLEGGPGGSPLADPDIYAATPFRTRRDVIAIDQRGTGYSRPSLNCFEFDTADDIFRAEEACHQRLVNQGIDLSGYTSKENAADIAALWRVLGYNEVNLYGVSYGTRLALSVMRYHPEGIRSVVIDGVYPPEVNSEEDDPQNFYDSITAMFEDCSNDTACNAAFPNLQQRFYQMLRQLRDTPASAFDPESQGNIDLFAADIIGTIYQQMYATSIIPSVPLAIDAATNGDYDTFLDVITYGADADYGDYGDYGYGYGYGDQYGYGYGYEYGGYGYEYGGYGYEYGGYGYGYGYEYGGYGYGDDGYGYGGYGYGGDQSFNDGDSEGMYNSVTCNEEMPFNDFDRVYTVAEAANIPPVIINNIVFSDLFDTCAMWQSGVADPIENEPVTSNIPTLVLSGEYDPATPPRWGQSAADHLPNSWHFIFPATGHGQVDAGDCPVGIAMAFLDNPTQQPDSSCIAQMQITFITER